MNYKRTIVTAALPYANGHIHLGHIAGAYLPADIFVRFKRLKNEDVIFICGSDEHGVPITITADKEKITPQQVVDRYHFENKKAFERLGMSFDNYSRTSLPLHHKTAQDFFLKFYEKGILKQKKELQYYDESAKMFLPDRYLLGICPHCKSEDARGDQCESCGSYLNPTDLIEPKSKITGKTPILKETTHWYFPLGNYQQRLEKYLNEKNEEIGWKENVLNYCKSWFNDGLQDRAVTRDLDWGVKLPIENSENKVLYVWFDAVLGYISSTKEWAENKGEPELWKKYWLSEATNYYAFIGKDNVVFHCIVFPSMIMAWNDNDEQKVVLPNNVPANEFLNYQGLKFSKSKGWGIDVRDFLDIFNPDSLRYYMATILPENRDSDFYWKDFQAKYNNELADIYGNFVNRALTFADKHFNGLVPEISKLEKIDIDILELIKTTKEKVEVLLERVKIKEALSEIMNLARAANKFFNDSEPWKTIKSNREIGCNTINTSLQLIRSINIMLSPFIPFNAEKIFDFLNIGEDELKKWSSVEKPLLKAGHKLNKAEILFRKIEDKEIERFIPKEGEEEKRGTEKKEEKKSVTEGVQLININEFKKVNIKTGKISEATKVEKSEKLLKLKVELGNEIRQIIAGIAKYYKPEDIINKKVLVVANLERAKILGEQSEGMILAVEKSDKTLGVIFIDDTLPTGLTLR